MFYLLHITHSITCFRHHQESVVPHVEMLHPMIETKAASQVRLATVGHLQVLSLGKPGEMSLFESDVNRSPVYEPLTPLALRVWVAW